MARFRIPLAALMALCLGTAAPRAQEVEPRGEPGPTREEIVERLVELRRELDALLEALPEELRADVERRLAGGEPGLGREEAEDAGAEEAEGRAIAAPAEVPTVEPAPASLAPDPPRCVHLEPFDTNGDGALSGLDRYWRYFKLWLDDGDGDVEGPAEIRNLYDSGIAELPVDLKRYTAVDGADGEVWIDGALFVRIEGRRPRRAVLVIDADRLAADGEYRLAGAAGDALRGLQPVRPGVALEGAEESRPLLCP